MVSRRDATKYVIVLPRESAALSTVAWAGGLTAVPNICLGRAGEWLCVVPLKDVCTPPELLTHGSGTEPHQP